MPKTFDNLSEKNKYWREWYAANPEQRKKHYQRTKVAKQKYKDWAYSLKLGKKCKYCGETEPICLDFHHRNPENKIQEISTMIKNRIAKEKLLAEIAKCDLVCANCHRKLHAGLV